MAKTTFANVTLVRSDLGDGGWSLHHEDEEAPLVTGEAIMVDGEWDRPNANDYDIAIGLILTRLS